VFRVVVLVDGAHRSVQVVEVAQTLPQSDMEKNDGCEASSNDYSDFEHSDIEDCAHMVEEGCVCPICLETPALGEAVLLTCEHKACLPCLGGWLRSRVRSGCILPQNLSCPMCRSEIEPSIISRLLLHKDDGTLQMFESLQNLQAQVHNEIVSLDRNNGEQPRASQLEAPRPHIVQVDHPALQAVTQALLSDDVPLPDILQTIAQARFHQLHLELQGAVREVLGRAIIAHDFGSLRTAIDEGRLVGLGVDALAEAEALLTEENQRQVRVSLRKAVQRRDPVALREALAEGRASGLPGEELKQAHEVLKSERLRRARDGLDKSIKSLSAGTLYRAIVDGKAAGLETSELEKAEGVLADLRALRAPRDTTDFRARSCRWRPARSKGGVAQWAGR